MEEDITTLNLRIEGIVRGVGFRDFALREAQALKLAGWVRNRADGTVEALASGPTKSIEAFVARCTQGPPAARVSAVNLAAAAAPERSGFILRPTV